VTDDPILDDLLEPDREWLSELTEEEQQAYREHMKGTFAYQRAKVAHDLREVVRPLGANAIAQAEQLIATTEAQMDRLFHRSLVDALRHIGMGDTADIVEAHPPEDPQ